MQVLKQSVSLFHMNMRGVAAHPGASLVTIVGVACVAGVLAAMLSIGAGMRAGASKNARDDRAILRTVGSEGVADSRLARDAARTLENAPGIKRGADGKPLVSAIVSIPIEGQRRNDSVRTAFPVWGIVQDYTAIFPEIRITKGRTFRAGLRELIVGARRASEMIALDVGDRVRLRGVEWTVVGHFDAGGSDLEGRALANVDTLMTEFDHPGYNIMKAVLESPRSLEDLQRFVAATPSVRAQAVRESDDARAQGRSYSRFVDMLSYGLGAVMAVGATLGVVSAMHAIIDSRRRSLVTLRALGFKPAPLLMSVLAESMALALLGAAIGIGIAWLEFSGRAIHTVGLGITLALTPPVLAMAAGWGIAMGAVGGLVPAVRAVTMPITDGLRAN